MSEESKKPDFYELLRDSPMAVQVGDEALGDEAETRGRRGGDEATNWWSRMARLSELLARWSEVPAGVKIAAAALTHLRDRARNGARVLLYEDGSRKVAETNRSEVAIERRGSRWVLRYSRRVRGGTEIAVADLGSDDKAAEELLQAVQRVVREVPDDIEIPETAANRKHIKTEKERNTEGET